MLEFLFGFSIEDHFVLQLAKRIRFKAKRDELVRFAGALESEDAFRTSDRGCFRSGLNLLHFGSIQKRTIQAERELIRVRGFAINFERERRFVADEALVFDIKIVADFARLHITEGAVAKKTQQRSEEHTS